MSWLISAFYLTLMFGATNVCRQSKYLERCTANAKPITSRDLSFLHEQALYFQMALNCASLGQYVRRLHQSALDVHLCGTLTPNTPVC